jgi:hypothetical protein
VAATTLSAVEGPKEVLKLEEVCDTLHQCRLRRLHHVR